MHAAYRIYEDGDGRGDLARHQRSDLLMKTDFKWLMAGAGYHVDPQRLEADASYVQACLQFALESDCGALRTCAACLAEEIAGAALPADSGHRKQV